MKIAVTGAGAAGCFCAANLKRLAPQLDVCVFEAGPKALAKVAVSGGGRCNISNSFESVRSLKEVYPRGERVMQRALKAFSKDRTLEWFEQEGVPLVLEDGQFWFPASQNAMDVVNALLNAMNKAGVKLITRHPVTRIEAEDTGFSVDGSHFDFVVVTTGGANKGLGFLDSLGLDIVPPLPSLFTFHIADRGLNELSGIVCQAALSLPGTPFRAEGALLITDWGLSGPASLKLSSYAARHLASCGYKSEIAINWMNLPENVVREILEEKIAGNPKKLLASTPLLQSRLWMHILSKTGITEDCRWSELGRKGLNRLCARLTGDIYRIQGKSRLRKEFVTAGGVALENINISTLECKKHRGLFFAGEVLDVDAVTGGFNLQAAWSTGMVCAMEIAKAVTRQPDAR